jgi:hypothetical protein
MASASISGSGTQSGLCISPIVRSYSSTRPISLQISMVVNPVDPPNISPSGHRFPFSPIVHFYSGVSAPGSLHHHRRSQLPTSCSSCENYSRSRGQTDRRFHRFCRRLAKRMSRYRVRATGLHHHHHSTALTIPAASARVPFAGRGGSKRAVKACGALSANRNGVTLNFCSVGGMVRGEIPRRFDLRIAS